MTDVDHDAEVEIEYGPGDYICRALWNTIDDLEARGFTQGHIAQELLWLLSQVARGAGRCPEQAAEQVRYFRQMADCMSHEASRIEQTFGVVGEAAAPATALADAVTAGSA
jgi:hypothetical protein